MSLVELDPVAGVARILTQPLSFTKKCEQMLGVLAQAVDADIVTLREPDSEGLSMELIAFYKRPEITDIDFPQSIPLRPIPSDPEPITLAISDTSKVSQPIPSYLEGIQRSAVIVPIHQDGMVIGRLGFGSTRLNHFDERADQMLTNISSTFGVLIQNARLLEHREVEANIGRILSSSLDAPESFAAFAKEAKKIIGFDRLIISSIKEEEKLFTTEFAFGEEVKAHPISTERSYLGTMVEEVANTRKGQIFPRIDIDQSPNQQLAKFPKLSLFIEDGYRFFISVPLISADRLVGTLAIMRKESQFTSEELTTTDRLGSLVSGPLANFKLEESKRKSEKELQQSRTILEVEANIGRILSAPMGLQRAFDSLRDQCGRIIKLDRFTMAAIDLATETYSEDFDSFLDSSSLFGGIGRSVSGEKYAGSISEVAITTGHGLIVNNDDLRVISGEMGRAQKIFENGYSSMVAAPIIYEEKTIGTIVFSRETGVYQKEDIPVAERIARLLAGGLETFRMWTERNHAVQALSESEGRFRQIADSIGGVFWLVDIDPHRLVYASPKFFDIWGLEPEEVYADFFKYLESVHTDDRDRVRASSVESTSTGTVDLEYRIINQSGEVRWVRSSGFPVRNERGNLIRVCGITEDITNKKLELERITEAGRLLSIGELASGVAHEINNPLACINLYSEMLMQSDLPSSAMEDLQVITKQSRRAGDIVRNLLQFARKSAPNTSNAPAKEFLEQCIYLKNHDFNVSNIAVKIDVAKGLETIAIDEQLMTQVIVNILSNAEQACVAANGGGKVTVVMRTMDSLLRISVTDNGLGIPPENLSKIFTPFFTTKEVGDGTGLGLSVSYGIIAQMGGRLWAESDGKTWSTINIEIPQEQIEAMSEPGLGVQALEDGYIPPMKVLVVDDEEDLRNIMARLLERHNCTVDRANEGAEAWSMMQAGIYDCILLDLRMPGVDGQELFRRINQNLPSMSNKVIFVTGDLANSKSRQFLSTAPNYVLEKPIDIPQLIETVMSVAQAN